MIPFQNSYDIKHDVGAREDEDNPYRRKLHFIRQWRASTAFRQIETIYQMSKPRDPHLITTFALASFPGSLQSETPRVFIAPGEYLAWMCEALTLLILRIRSGPDATALVPDADG
jgi:hypothetical protein